MISPKRGQFNVTDKGGLLAKGYFDLRAVYPNLILATVLAIGLARGLYSMIFQPPRAAVPGVPAQFDLGDIQPADRPRGAGGRP